MMTDDTKIDMWLIPYILYVGVCLREAVFMSYLYDQFFFIIFIFATNMELYNSMLQIIILTKTIGFFFLDIFCKVSASGCCLAFT